ncbi:hypothetical protein AHAS_Ahas16G0196800 [Arachis hypogaea]
MLKGVVAAGMVGPWVPLHSSHRRTLLIILLLVVVARRSSLSLWCPCREGCLVGRLCVCEKDIYVQALCRSLSELTSIPPSLSHPILPSPSLYFLLRRQ